MTTVQDIYELSPMQQGMLFHTLYAPESGVYFEQRHCLLEGNLDVAAFKQAWQTVVERHPVLRTAFYWEAADKPLQVVYASAELPWVEADWQTLSEPEQAGKLAAFLQSDRAPGFRLDQAPLMRCALFQIGPKQHRFVWSHHHLLMDGWCNAVLIKEVLAFYTAQRQGQSLRLTPPLPYRDYIVWLQQQDQQAAQAYWQRTLAGFTAPTSLGIDRIRPGAAIAAKHGDQWLTLSQSTTADLNAFAQRHHLTLNTLIQGAWAVLLSRYDDTADVVFGATVSGRPPTLPGADAIIGLFINTVPVRVTLPPDVFVLPWLQQIQAAQRDHEAYAYSPLTDIQAWSAVPRGVALFESLLVFENYPMSLDAALSDSSSGLVIRDGQGFEQTNYPLALVVIPGDTLAFRANYNPSRISAPAIQRLLSHLEVLLQGLITNSEQPLSALPLMTRAEQQQFTTWNQTGQPLPDQCVHELIAAQAQATPEATAVAFAETTLTYRDLDRRAHQLAQQLQSLGVGPEVPVAVCIERSPDLVVALLGILQAGGAYLPIDPSYPRDRLSWMLQDAAPPVLITHPATQTLADTLSSESDHIQQLNLHPTTPPPHHPTTPPPFPSPTPDNAIYILYTSGSTGRPKGVINTHRGLVNRLCWMQDTYSLTPGDLVLQKTPLSFDVSAWEFFWPLLTGATLVLARPDGHKDSAYLADLIQQGQITTLHFVPSMLAAFLEAPEAAQCTSLKRVICSGEAMPTDLQTRFFQTLPSVELHNLYGPTEAAIDVTAWACQPDDDASPTVPIGRPIANTQIHLLDSLGRLVPPGIPGELHIGGVGVARGYLNRPDLTAEKFVPNPFGQGTGHREQGAGDGRQETGDRRQEAEEPYSLFPIPCSPLYKTGDRACYRPDGAIEFLGRIDHQVKLRGFRIELGEIEAVLAQHPEVAQAVVVLRAESEQTPQLVAYVVQATDEVKGAEAFETNGVGSIPSSPTPQLPNSPAPSTLRTYLSEHLPTYMVPTQFVPLDALPLTPNGKVDRKALPAPERPEPNRAVAAPRTVTAELLANIWAAVLGQDVIGQDDNFFELGGHSLLATRVVAQVRQAFGVELPLRSLFEQPTLTQLAPVVDGLKSGRGDAALEPIQQVARSGNLPLADAQQRQWILAQLEPDSPFYVIPTAVQVQGNLSVDLLQQSLQQLVERHEVLRTAFQDVSGNAQIVLRPSVEIEVPVVDLTELQEAAQQQRMQTQIQAEAQTPFDLSQAPLLRLKVLRLAAQDHVVLLSLHHIIADGWSMGVMVRELAQVYEALRSHQSPELPPLPIQYVDYAAWQQQQSAEQTEHLDYWQQQLHGAPPLLELPTDYPRPAVQSFAGATCEFQLTAAQTQSLEKLSQQQGVTLFMTLLAAFQVVLHRYSGFTDIVIGTPVANRPRTELEGLIGMFVNTLVLRTDLADNPRFEELLGRVREVALEAYAHQSTPFEQVVEALEVSRSWSHAPLFQVMFVLQNAPLQPLILDELAWQPLSMESGTAKFDLTLSMRPTDGGLQGALEYRTDLFEADTVQRLVGHLFTLLTTICEQPRSRLAELPLLTEIEQTQLWQWNQTQTEYPRHRCIHELFEQQVEKTPQAIALSFGDQSFTYQALNENANQLAGYLRSPAITATITADTLIGLWADRCPATIVAMLAILKAGGAYVPLDPNYPAERLQFMIEDAGLDLVIAPQAIDLPLAADTCQLLVLNAEAVAMAQQRTTNLPTSATIENLAYVLYTSGSTGQPKGVCTPHRGVVRLVKNTNYVQFGADEVCLQAASLSFDASTFEIWGALLNGGKLVLLPTPSPSLADLAQAIAQHQVTTLWLTAGLFHLMVDEQLEALKSVRQLLAGGDVLSGAHVHKALSALKHTRLINGYGPTENTTFTCCHTITAASLNTTALKSSPPIGSPIANTQVHILDAELQPVPIGVPGELYIAGDGLARGYLNRPELTAAAFVPNPFARVRGQERRGTEGSQKSTFSPSSCLPIASDTLYKTGDRVCYRPDGTIEFLGRLDNQVKIRGFRIELDEIETALLSHPDVEQAIVTPWTTEDGNQRLVAYFVKAEGREKSEARKPLSPSPYSPTPHIRSFLADQLPAYMLPAAFVVLEALPLTRNGKVDRRSLPAPTWESETTGELAQTSVEQTLTEIWAAVLRLETVGRHDNFFDVGGDSILALQMVSRAAQAGISLSPRQIFQYQTIAELALVAETTTNAGITPIVATGAVPLTPIQQWFFAQDLANPHYFNQAVYLELPLDIDRDALERSLQQVVNYHDALRLRFAPTASGWQQHYGDVAGVQPIAWFDLSTLTADDQVQQVEAIANELQASLQLETGPLMRVGGFELGAGGPQRLLIVMHHLVVDGLSWRILLADLRLAYQQEQQGISAQLPPKTHSFQQWAAGLASTAEQAEAGLSYWQNLPLASPLPLDQSPGENIVAAAKMVTASLSRQQTQALLQAVSSTHRTQINDVLLTALVQVLSDWTGRHSHLITLENHGRHAGELGAELNLSRTVGWFTCLHPVALQLVGTAPGERLTAIKTQLRQVPHQGLSYGLWRYGTGDESLAVQPPISFNYLGQFDGLLAEAADFQLLTTPGMTSDGQNQRSHLIDINGWIRDDQLQMTWTYSRHHHHRSTLEHLASEYMSALQQLIVHCQTSEPDYSPEDFNLVQLDQATLEAVLGNVTFQGGASQ